MSKAETISFFDGVIAHHDLRVRYGEEVYAMRRIEDAARGCSFVVQSSKGAYETKVLAVAIGVLGRPNRPKEYRHPPSLKNRLLFDITSQRLEGETVLVVGGGDTAAEYAQYLAEQNNRVTLSYRGAEFKRLNDLNHATLLALENANAVEILRGSNISGVEDDGGRPRVSFREAEHSPRVFDRVVYALGGTTPTNFLRTLGIEFDGGGPRFDEAGETSVPGLFLIGDLTVSKTGGSIITAFNSASRAMKRINVKYLASKFC
jgi:thioredoxin reductase (NADPH)